MPDTRAPLHAGHRRPRRPGRIPARLRAESAERATDTIDGHREAGLRLIRGGRFFEAHEELELAWRAAPAEERDFYQGLVHVAVAWYQAGRGRPVATGRQLEKASRRLAAYAPSHHGVDVAGVLAQLGRARETVTGGSLDLPPPRV